MSAAKQPRPSEAICCGPGRSGASAYKSYMKDGTVDFKGALIDGAIGAVSNVLTLGVGAPKNRVTSGKMVDRLVQNSKNIVEEGAKKITQHGTRALVKKSNYGAIVAGNVGYSFGTSGVIAASNMFWSKKVMPCLTR